MIENTSQDSLLNRYPELSRQLHEWFNAHKQEYGPNLRNASERIGIGYSAMRHYFAGHSFPTGVQLEALRAHTHLPVLHEKSIPIRTAREAELGTSSTSGAQRRADIGESLEGAPSLSARNKNLLIALRVWVGENTGYRNRRTLARALDVDERTLQRWLSGEGYPEPDHQARITRLTGIEFTAHGPVIGSLARPVAKVTARPVKTAKSAVAVHDALLELLRRLDPFVKGSAEDRRILQEACPRDDAGFVTSLLNAIYDDEETFQTWRFFNVESRYDQVKESRHK